MNKIVLCCGKVRCPIVERTVDGFKITDDDGGFIKLTDEQMRLLKEAEVDDLQIL